MRVLLHGEAARQHGTRGFLRRTTQALPHRQHSVGKSRLPEIHIQHGTYQLHAARFKVERIRHHAWRHLHVGARKVAPHLGHGMTNGVHAWHEHVIDAPFEQLRHVAIHKLHREAHLALSVALGSMHSVFVRCVGYDHVESQVPEKRICHREQLMHHKAARHAYRFLGRVALRIIAGKIGLFGLSERLLELFHDGEMVVHLMGLVALQPKAPECRGRKLGIGRSGVGRNGIERSDIERRRIGHEATARGRNE